MIKNLLIFLKSLNKVQTYLLVAAVIALYLFLKSFIVNTYSPRLNKLELENQKFRTLLETNRNKIEELSGKITSRDSVIKYLEKKDVELYGKYLSNEKELQKLNRKYEKINSIDKFNSADIRNYFSENYGN